MTHFSTVARRLRPGAAALCIVTASGLSGCVSLLPKAQPSQLYRFGGVDIPSAVGPVGPLSSVVLSQIVLPAAAQGDGILTATGDQAAYIAGARWASPAALMFQEDVQQAFDAGARRTRLVDRSGVGVADALLRLDVSRFEVRYDPQAPQAAPRVMVAVRATLTRPDGHLAQQRLFSRDLPAPQDRVNAIVGTFDHAVNDTLAEIVAWTDQTTPSLTAPSPAGVSQPASPTQVSSPSS